jgi:DNA processing protein
LSNITQIFSVCFPAQKAKSGANEVINKTGSLTSAITDATGGHIGIAMTERQRVNWLRLWRSDNVGPVTFRQLINHFGSAEAAIEGLPQMALRGGAGRMPKVPNIGVIEDELAAVEKIGARIVGIGEPDFPKYLRLTPDCPPLITYKGSASVFQLPGLSVVGARNASLAGVKFTGKLAGEIGAEGYSIVSGLARGIDTAAHRAALRTGTIAAMAGGLSHPYPPENVELFHAIPDNGGAVITEMPYGWEPRAKDFPRRNRIIAALGLGLLVVEAAQRSGSLISARLANELGRIVFAVPGSPLDPRCEGTNNLLKNGATLVSEARDLLDALQPLTRIGSIQTQTLDEPAYEDLGEHETNDDDRRRIIEALGPTPIAIDEIIAYCGLSAAKIYFVLLELDIAGRLQRHSGGAVSLVFLDN